MYKRLFAMGYVEYKDFQAWFQYQEHYNLKKVINHSPKLLH